ncbi:helix-turn-helix domain-containing protein [Corynebacterium appendicis]|uniref:helix-turn-helix domain-containing protein n=1 Tax=Corynebacterium appendicis TaxID=163202 RepID=UPI0009707358|nr:helix-turn-helix domain-containing protein [Corynebacterium appendicis]
MGGVFRAPALDALSNHPPVNLSVLKNNRAKAFQFTTLTAICQAPDCQPGEVFSVK